MIVGNSGDPVDPRPPPGEAGRASRSPSSWSMARGMDAERYFSREEIERAGAYHRPLYRYVVIRAAFGLAYPGVLAFTSAGRWLAVPVDHLPLWSYALAYPTLILALAAVLRLPLSVWRHGYERRWGLSTQSLGGWFVDWVKALAVGVALTSTAFLGLVELAAAVPDLWPVPTAGGAALLVGFLSFVGPVVLEPLFNRFRPLRDEALAAELRALADRAGVPVRHVLVSDASRRTRKENAYVSGLSRTRRVVVYDTLLERGSPREVRLVVAHELGHWRARHLAKGTALGMVGAAGLVVCLWPLLQRDPLLAAIGAGGPADPRIAPFVLLAVGVLTLLVLPVGNAISRRWEADADRVSIDLTGDVDGFVESERNLALSNLADLAPGRLAYLVLFTHPSPPERIAAALSAGRPTTA